VQTAFFVHAFVAVLGASAGNPPPGECRRLTTPGAAVRCAVARAPAVEVARADIDAARARREGARVVLPSNPSIDFTAAHRRGPSDRDFNLYGTLRQEIEIAGQRRARTKVADAGIDASRADASATRRRIAVDALTAWYHVVASRHRVAMLDRSLTVARALETLARERSSAGASAGIELDLATAARIVAARRRVDVAREEAVALAQLGGLLGIDPKLIEVGDSLAPIALDRGGERPEIEGASARVRVHERRTTVLKRDRAPDPVFVVTVQRDGFGELVAGGGVSLGIPLPSPFGRTLKGEIAESRATVRRARAEQEVVRRGISAEIATAEAELAARRELLALYDDATLTGARDALGALAEAVVAGQIDLRGGLVAQQSLIELLDGRIDAEHGLCDAAVQLAWARGLDLEGVP
jgi:outer membrane protein, heavy metal efflux system